MYFLPFKLILWTQAFSIFKGRFFHSFLKRNSSHFMRNSKLWFLVFNKTLIPNGCKKSILKTKLNKLLKQNFFNCLIVKIYLIPSILVYHLCKYPTVSIRDGSPDGYLSPVDTRIINSALLSGWRNGYATCICLPATHLAGRIRGSHTVHIRRVASDSHRAYTFGDIQPPNMYDQGACRFLLFPVQNVLITLMSSGL